MKFTTLDKIVRSALVDKSLPLHFYMQCLNYAADCFRDLTLHSLHAINTVELNVDQTDFIVTLPCDYVDYTKVGVRVGQLIRPIQELASINRLQNVQSNGVPTTFGIAGEDIVGPESPLWPGYFLFQNINDLGENIGRMYGYNSNDLNNVFKILPERNQIQLGEAFEYPTLVLEYISDGQCIDNLTCVDIYAWDCIKYYILMKLSEAMKQPMGVLALNMSQYKNGLRKLRAARGGVTISDIKQILHKNFNASIKN